MNETTNQFSTKTIHVFASDFLPFPGCPRTAGGNRSMQIISALRRAGHRVTFSMPIVSDMAKKNLQKIDPQLTEEERWLCENFFEPDIVLSRVMPNVAVYCNINCFRTIKRFSTDIVHVLDLYGPLQFEGLLLDASDPNAAMQDGAGLERRCLDMVEKIRSIDYLVTVSERQKYFWSAYCTLAGFSFGELNVLVCPAAFDVPPVARKTAPDLTVVYSGGFYPWQNPDRSLRAAAKLLDEIDGSVLHIFGGPHPGLPNEQDVRQMLSELQQHRSVVYHGYRPVEELLATLSTAWCALELMDQNIERELAITGRTVEFLASGTPVIYNNYATLSKLIGTYNAGWTLDPNEPFAMREIFAELLRGGLPYVHELSENAKRLAALEFSADTCSAPIITLCNGPLEKRSKPPIRQVATVHPRRTSSALGRVLAISPDANALVELRINNPLRALQRQGCISGMSVIDPSCEALKNDHSLYDAVVLQRALPPLIYQTLKNLAIDFLQDIDDNTLARASYRQGIPPETEILEGLRYCKVLTSPNPRLVRALERYSGLPLAHKTYLTPNALPFPSPARSRPAVQPSQIIWIQSDIAALANSRAAVVQAVEDFSIKYNLPVVLIGRNVIDRPQFHNQVVLGQLDFATNLQMLEFGVSSIGVAPLETHADQETLDFVAGKSDLKILLFAGYGHPAVYSDSPPYRDSNLQIPGSLVSNDYDSWSAALEYQYEEGWKSLGEATLRVQSERHTDHVALNSWFPSLQACALAKPVRGADLYEALATSQKVLNTPTHAVGYMLANHDVSLNYLAGTEHSAWHHYLRYGHRERRAIMHDAAAQRETLSDLERQAAQLLQQGAQGIASFRQTIAVLQSQSADMRRTIENLGSQIGELKASYSWKVTEPLRKLMRPFMG